VGREENVETVMDMVYEVPPPPPEWDSNSRPPDKSDNFTAKAPRSLEWNRLQASVRTSPADGVEGLEELTVP